MSHQHFIEQLNQAIKSLANRVQSGEQSQSQTQWNQPAVVYQFFDLAVVCVYCRIIRAAAAKTNDTTATGDTGVTENTSAAGWSPGRSVSAAPPESARNASTSRIMPLNLHPIPSPLAISNEDHDATSHFTTNTPNNSSSSLSPNSAATDNANNNTGNLSIAIQAPAPVPAAVSVPSPSSLSVPSLTSAAAANTLSPSSIPVSQSHPKPKDRRAKHLETIVTLIKYLAMAYSMLADKKLSCDLRDCLQRLDQYQELNMKEARESFHCLAEQLKLSQYNQPIKPLKLEIPEENDDGTAYTLSGPDAWQCGDHWVVPPTPSPSRSRAGSFSSPMPSQPS